MKGRNQLKKLLLSIFISLSLLFTSQVNSNPDEYSIPRSQVTFLESQYGEGSGVVIANGLVLTAAHVAETMDKANIVAIEDLSKTTRDLAIMSYKEVTCPCVKLAEYEAKLDEKVIIIGYPYAFGQVLTEGRSQGIYDYSKNSRYLEGVRLLLTAAVQPGNSGGGVFVYREGEWQLVGILVQGTHSGVISFAITLKDIRDYIKEVLG